jgi:hypothetical protein
MIHGSSGGPDVVIGDDVTVGHRAILHGCTIGDGCLIGMGAILLDEVIIGDHSLVAAGALVPPRTVIPPRSFVVGSPARIKREVNDDEMRDFIYQISESDSEDQFAENDDTLEDADKDTRIELLLSIAFTNQLMADEPKEVLLTIEQLTRLGVVEEDAFTRVFEVFSEEFFESHIAERAFDLSRYLKNLSKLSAEVESEK